MSVVGLMLNIMSCLVSPQIAVFYRASPRHKLKIVKVSMRKNNTCKHSFYLAAKHLPHHEL